MLMGEELMQGIEHFGRWHTQEFVARSQEIIDVLTYLRAERTLEMFKVASFITVDSIHFSRKTNLSPTSDETRGTSPCEEREI
jgi:hypothetical protein